MDVKCTYWVYVLECDNGAYYTGYTDHLIKRYRLHVSGKGGKFTRSFKPIRLLQSWVFDNKSSAMRAEKWIKQLTRKEKEHLLCSPDSFSKNLVVLSGLYNQT